MKIDSYLSPVDMTYTLKVTGLSNEQVRAFAAFAADQARFVGEPLDLSRVARPEPRFRKIDL